MSFEFWHAKYVWKYNLKGAKSFTDSFYDNPRIIVHDWKYQNGMCYMYSIQTGLILLQIEMKST